MPAPANDDFGSPTVITGDVSLTGLTTVDATADADGLVFGFTSPSIWFRIENATATSLTVSITNADYEFLAITSTPGTDPPSFLDWVIGSNQQSAGSSGSTADDSLTETVAPGEIVYLGIMAAFGASPDSGTFDMDVAFTIPGPPPVSPTVQVYIDGSDVTGCVRSGAVTRRLNRPWQASVQLYSECATGTACSKMKVVINGTLWFHGFVTQISTEAGEDGALISEYTALDPMMLWQWRPARDGPDSADPGDFSNPDFFQEFQYGPQILEQLLLQSEDDSDPEFGEGSLFIDLAGASYAAGTVDMSGAPTDWPMTIAEVFELMSSTGTLDAILTPIDSGGNMASLAVYNGDYGTDRTASVNFDYATGDLNVRTVRMTEDSTNVCNKLWYFLGPRVLGPTDPAGNQHWRANVQGDDPGLPGYPGSSPYSDVISRRDDSRDSCGVRMEVRIYDAQGDENPASFRELYRRLWIMESWLRAVPRTLVHVTPVRQSDNMQLPPGVNPVAVGAFDIGDLVTVSAGSIVRGGFSGAQRIYEYTVSWDEDGILELGELMTSADQEGIA